MGGKEVHREYTRVNVHEQKTKEEEEMDHLCWIHQSNWTLITCTKFFTKVMEIFTSS
jgi:hypothetical protein